MTLCRKSVNSGNSGKAFLHVFLKLWTMERKPFRSDLENGLPGFVFFSLASQGVHKVPFGILIRLVFAFGPRSAIKFEFWPSRGEKSGHHWHRIKNQGVMLSRLVYCHCQKYAGGLFYCSEKLKDVTAPLPVWSDRLWLACEGDLLNGYTQYD